MSLTFEWTVALEADGNAGIGRCEYQYGTEIEDGDTIAEGSSHGYIVVTYYVDDSMIVRAKDRGGVNRSDELDPDPWESGVVLEPSE